ncbi:MAG: hypothetical protein HC905_19320 [Bacteroidales bacterium]|nr:hypothetical protein [Bacteroidales bacterium]
MKNQKLQSKNAGLIQYIISDICRYSNYISGDFCTYPNSMGGDRTHSTLLSDKKVEELKNDSLRQQIISYATPILTDTQNLVYLIPVEVKTLDKPEKIDSEVLGIMDSQVNYEGGSMKKYSPGNYYGYFNNLLVYDYNKGALIKMCDGRLLGKDMDSHYYEDEIITVFTGADKDTDGDGKITVDDLSSVYVFSLKERKIRQLRQENATVVSYEFVKGEKNMLITFGFDRNKNNEFEMSTEPTFIMHYDFNSGELNRLVSKELENKLQK